MSGMMVGSGRFDWGRRSLCGFAQLYGNATRNSNLRFASTAIFPIPDIQSSAMSLNDISAQKQPNPRSRLFGSVKWHK
jgi:hypothetical protein